MNSEHKWIECYWSPHIWLGVGFSKAPRRLFISGEVVEQRYEYEIAICIPFCLISITFMKKLNGGSVYGR